MCTERNPYLLWLWLAKQKPSSFTWYNCGYYTYIFKCISLKILFLGLGTSSFLFWLGNYFVTYSDTFSWHGTRSHCLQFKKTQVGVRIHIPCWLLATSNHSCWVIICLKTDMACSEEANGVRITWYLSLRSTLMGGKFYIPQTSR